MTLDRSQILITRVALARPKSVFSGYFEKFDSRNHLFTIETFLDTPDAIVRLQRYSISGISLINIRDGLFPSSPLIDGSSSHNICLHDTDRAWLELVAD